MRNGILALALVLGACSESASPPPSTSPDDSPDTSAPTDAPTDDRPAIPAAECEARGGTVVGDIGDGAIHKPDYRCPGSGEPPLGSIAVDPDGPIGVEGSVCCK